MLVNAVHNLKKKIKEYELIMQQIFLNETGPVQYTKSNSCNI